MKSPGSRVASITALFVILLGVSTVMAQPAASSAEAAYQEGRRLYDLGEWDQAITRFKEAYRLRSDAASLFNIAQSYRLKGDCGQAVNFYKVFKRTFPAEKAAEKATKFVAELEPCAKQQAVSGTGKPDPEPATPVVTRPEPTAPVTTTTTEPTAPPPASPAPAERGGGGLRIAGIVTASVGVLALGAGVYFGTQASARETELAKGIWDEGVYNDGKSADRNAKITLTIGGAAVIGGTVMYFLGRRAGSETAGVALIPSGGGGSVVWSCAL